MNKQDIQYAYLPLAKVIAEELIEIIPLKSTQDLRQQKIKIEQHINFCLRSLPPVRQQIVSCQILG